MEAYLSIQNIVDNAVKDITKRVAHIDLCRVQTGFTEKADASSLCVSVEGEYKIRIVYNAEKQFMCAIAEHMKHSPVESNEEISMFTKEYFNILCGHVVSTINRMTHASARFGIPRFTKDVCSLGEKETLFFVIYYKSEHGYACIKGICDNNDSHSGPLSHFSDCQIPTKSNTEKEGE